MASKELLKERLDNLSKAKKGSSVKDQLTADDKEDMARADALRRRLKKSK